jgi:NADPH-dependent glutamate synthase beta subunit-like oxidoreductase
MVIGGGPAGLEAARVAALRGHSVQLFERQDELGGQLRLWAMAPAMSELRKVVDWQERQLERLGVEVHTSREMTADEVATAGADVAIVATGSLPLSLGSRPWVAKLSGAADSNLLVTTPHDVLEGKSETLMKAIVWDHAGGTAGSQIALSSAELLAKNAAEVQVVTPNFAVGEDVHPTTRTPLYQRLLSAGVVFTPNSEVSALDGTSVVVRNVYSGEEQRILRVGLLVTWLGSRAYDDLWNDLNGRLREAYAVGDCVAPRSVEAATMEGAKIARAL